MFEKKRFFNNMKYLAIKRLRKVGRCPYNHVKTLYQFRSPESYEDGGRIVDNCLWYLKQTSRLTKTCNKFKLLAVYLNITQYYSYKYIAKELVLVSSTIWNSYLLV